MVNERPPAMMIRQGFQTFMTQTRGSTKFKPELFDLVNVNVKINDLPFTFHNYRIINLTDIHLGQWISPEYLNGVADYVNSLNPDMITLTGDYVSYILEGYEDDLLDSFKKLKAKDGKYAVLGNHDHWAGAEEIRKILKKSNIVDLSNDVFTIEKDGEKLNISGFKYYNRQDIKEFSDQPFWKIKNEVMQLIVECKSKDIKMVSNDMLKKKRGKTNSNISKRKKFRKEKPKTTAKEELDKLIGLNGIKEEVQKILNYVKLNKERGKMPTLHMCFNGNPGTGKTSVARVIGKLFDEENILPGNGEFVEIHGRDLVAKYVGWTAQKVHDTVEKAIGGVLFIDEAYSLVSSTRGSFEDEAIATLIKEMEDHRDEICIILAGYTNEMKELIKLNPGFESRIQFTIDFPDYSANELMQIFMGLCKKEKYKLSSNCEEVLIKNFEKARMQEDFGNGRYVRNVFEKTKFEQSTRIANTDSKNINTITSKDIISALECMNVGSGKKKRLIGF